MDIALVAQSASIDGWDVEPNSNFVDIIPMLNEGVPCLYIVKCHDEVLEFLKEGDGELPDILMMGLNMEVGIDQGDGGFGYECLGLAFVLGFEQELPIQIGDLCE